VHIEITLADAKGILNPVATNPVTVTVEGAAELIGLDNGKPDSHESFKGCTMKANGGKLLAVIRAKREAGSVTVKMSSGELKPVSVNLSVS